MSASGARPLLACALLGAVALAGCGLGAGRAPGGVQLTVTRDFGATVLGAWSAPRVVGQETVMSLLMRNASVATRYSGGFVQSVNGVAGGHERGRPVDWFYYVNGIEAPKGAAATNLNSGDHVWWDRHNWSQTDHVPAVVGSFPEPFLNGIDGKRLPVRVECTSVGGAACRAVTATLRASGVPAPVSALASGSEPHTLRVMVGPWNKLRGDPTAATIEHGPAASGVFARFSPSGDTLTLLDADGGTAATLGAGAGLIAATASEESAPVWVVAGTDAAGVEHAAADFRQTTLRDCFAVAVSASATGVTTLRVPQ